MESFSFVDCHSHVVPSGDDGAQSTGEGQALCAEAARHATAILFATPHVWPHLPLTQERERVVRKAHRELRSRANLELRLGFELTPTLALLDDDPARYVLDGTRHVLTEVPFIGPLQELFAVAEHVEGCGLVPVVAHPERTEACLADPHAAIEIAEQEWPIQVNATSLLGRDGPAVERLAWWLVEEGHASLVASDGHRAARPARLDLAYATVRERMGERADALFDGSALGLATSRRESSRAAWRAA
jgi:protein-tyrosine phosphatase